MRPPASDREPHRSSHLRNLTALVLALSAEPRAVNAAEPMPVVEPDETGTTSNDIGHPLETFVKNSQRFILDHPLGLRLNFWDRAGKPRFHDWHTWMEPLTLEVGYPVAAEMFQVAVPYEFAPNFEITKPTSDTAFQEMKREMLERLREAWLQEIMAVPGSFFKDEVTIWDGTKPITDRPWQQALEVTSQARVSSIKITGSASPEHAMGDQALGDFFNEQLARRRGDDAQAALLEYFPYLAMDDLPVGFVVPEYSKDDLAALIRVAHEIGINPAEAPKTKLLTVIQKYNRGEIKQPTLQETVQGIVGDRRSVQLEVTFENGRQGVWQVPVPALFLLGLSVLRRYFGRRRQPEPPDDLQPSGFQPTRMVPPSTGSGVSGGSRQRRLDQRRQRRLPGQTPRQLPPPPAEGAGLPLPPPDQPPELPQSDAVPVPGRDKE